MTKNPIYDFLSHSIKLSLPFEVNDWVWLEEFYIFEPFKIKQIFLVIQKNNQLDFFVTHHTNPNQKINLYDHPFVRLATSEEVLIYEDKLLKCWRKND